MRWGSGSRSVAALAIVLGAVLLAGCAAEAPVLGPATPPASRPPMPVEPIELPEAPPRRAIVLFDDSVEDPWAAAALCECPCGVRVGHVYSAAMRGCAVEITNESCQKLFATQGVLGIVPDRVFELQAEGIPQGVVRIGGAVAIERGLRGDGVRVAVLDTGIDLDHPLLADRIDLELSRDFLTAERRPGDDDNGHGTHVAGIVAGTDGPHAIGVAPGATLVSLKVLDRFGFALESNIIAALDFITAHNRRATRFEDLIHVANLSIGGPGDDGDSPLHTAIRACVRSGAVVCVAAGNESNDSAECVPASFDEVITVSAFDAAKDVLAGFSNFGEDVDVAAPGVEVLSAKLGGGLVKLSGTSMASPHAAGAVAQFLAANRTQLAALWQRDRGGVCAYVRDRLLESGELPPAGRGWPGDPDAFPEPLVDLGRLLELEGDVAPVVSNEPGPETAPPAAEPIALDPVPAAPPEPATGDPALHVRKIVYDDDGVDLWIHVAVADEADRPISGVEVGIALCHRESPASPRHGFGEGSFTDETGTASYRVPGAGGGLFHATVRYLDKPGFARDPERDAGDPGYSRP